MYWIDVVIRAILSIKGIGFPHIVNYPVLRGVIGMKRFCFHAISSE